MAEPGLPEQIWLAGEEQGPVGGPGDILDVSAMEYSSSQEMR